MERRKKRMTSGVERTYARIVPSVENKEAD